ncbi:electron transport complex protein RnfC [Methylophilales bacterium HTCC2181]|uniref:Electron transport complex protein RnfC n=1 Tax=Methylophilales bacterium HTCC2181 TaxID=383631 RepID=A0P5N7_9PROT|nr:electron transport complex protein RnfC [Methylophilales bacterium HTCC2181]
MGDGHLVIIAGNDINSTAYPIIAGLNIFEPNPP